MQIQPISTLFDEFLGTTLDTTKWYTLADENTGTPGANTISISNSAVTMTQVGSAEWQLIGVNNQTWDGSEMTWGPISGQWYLSTANGRIRVQGSTLYLDGPFPGSGTSMPYNSTTMKYFKIVCGTSTNQVYYSANNYNWTSAGTMTVYILNSTNAVKFSTIAGTGTSFTLGAVNPLPNSAPNVSIVAPIDAATLTTQTPALQFDGIDPDADKVSFQLQVSTVKEFTSTTVDVLSTSPTGWSGGTDPYNSGATITYTLQSALPDGGNTYYWRVRAKDPAGTNAFGPWSATYSMITRPNPPTVTSGTVSAIASTTATAGGEVTGDGGGSVTERGVVYGTSPNPTTANGKQTAGLGIGQFNANLTGLTPNTVYNWRAYAINSRTTSYGANGTFTTLPSNATINSVNSVTNTGATVNATILANGGASITERGVVYSTVPNPTLANSKQTSGTGSGTYNTNITGLIGNTDYYVRAYATNNGGTSYSAQSTFKTAQDPGVPTVNTGTAGAPGETTVTITGSQVTLDGTQTVTERGIVYSSTNEDPTISNSKTASGSGLGTYNTNLTALAPETTYYARAYATNSLGTGYGSVVTFKTLALFIPDAGDGYWTWRPFGSDANVSRSQATPANASANLLLSDLNLEDNKPYTLWYSGIETDEGSPRMVLQWYDNFVKQTQVISPNTPYTFTYDKTKLSWAIRLYVTGNSAEPENINAVFKDMYLAQESTFSGFVPFVGKGATEIRIDNNWLLDKRREDTIQSIANEIFGLGWRQFTTKTTGLGWFEVGDEFTIIDDTGPNKVVVWESSFTLDGGITETLKAGSPQKTETDYTKSGTVTKSVKRTQISVDHNAQEINSLVEDVYSVDGVINKKFSEVEQDINGVRTTVESSGGVNLVKNSVMYAFNDAGVPDLWDVTGGGTLIIQASPESLSGGGISGNTFALSNKTVSQKVTVRKDVDFVLQEDKIYYSFSARVKKNTVGDASITLSNRNETWTIPLPDQTEFYWQVVKLENLLPLDDHYDITITSDADANLQVTDVMLAPGETVRQWTQSNGEAMNTNVSITDDGMTIRSSQFRNDYTKIDALGIEVHKHEAGGERVFGFNGDETSVRKLRAEQQISLAPIRILPITYDSYKGVAFTRTEDQ